jgi:hypothetical protein
MIIKCFINEYMVIILLDSRKVQGHRWIILMASETLLVIVQGGFGFKGGFYWKHFVLEMFKASLKIHNSNLLCIASFSQTWTIKVIARHDIAEILLKVALNTINPNPNAQSNSMIIKSVINQYMGDIFCFALYNVLCTNRHLIGRTH